MSKGKYSPALTRKMIAERDENTFVYNCYGDRAPTSWDGDYDSTIHFADYDKDGFDCYGYSAWGEDGTTFVGHGSGIDRFGYTEMDYMLMSDEKFEDICIYGA